MSFQQGSGDNQISGDFSQLEKLAREIGAGYYVDIGILGGSSQGEPGDEITLAGLGATHEFGTDKAGRNKDTVIQERSFIKMPLEKKSEKIQKAVDKKIQEGFEKSDIEGLFKIMGIAGEAVIQEAFETGGFGSWPDITEETKEAKGSDAILIKDAVLRKAVTSKVGGGEK